MITRPRLQSRLQPSVLLVALAAAGLAVATPAQATPILIDNFTVASSVSVTNNTDHFFVPEDEKSGSFGGFSRGPLA